MWNTYKIWIDIFKLPFLSDYNEKRNTEIIPIHEISSGLGASSFVVFLDTSSSEKK